MSSETRRGRRPALAGALCLVLSACAYDGPSLWTENSDPWGSQDAGPRDGGSLDAGAPSCGAEGQACCSTGSACKASLFCQPLTSVAAACEAKPTTCYEILTCASRCGSGDTSCGQPCYLAAPAAAQTAIDAFKACYTASCSTETASTIDACLYAACPAAYQACAP